MAVVHRLGPGIVAVIVGLVLSAALFVPFLAASFRVRGRVTVARTLLWIALLIAFLALWSYTIFPAPLPTDDYRCTTPNLDILYDLKDIIRIQEAGSSLIANAALQVALLNVLFFLPIGFLLRVMFGWGVVRATLAGFALSLAVEVTQLTGLWGIYPCSYRLFSVADLLHNTIGAVLGSLLALLIVRRGSRVSASAAPASDRVSGPVTAGRRMLAATADLVLYVTVAIGVGAVVGVLALSMGRQTDPWETALGIVVSSALYLAPILVTGTTWGERAVLIRVEGGWRPMLVARLVRAIGGLGGVIIALNVIPEFGGWVALGLIGVQIIFVWLTPATRSLGAFLAGMSVRVSPTPRGLEPPQAAPNATRDA